MHNESMFFNKSGALLQMLSWEVRCVYVMGGFDVWNDFFYQSYGVSHSLIGFAESQMLFSDRK